MCIVQQNPNIVAFGTVSGAIKEFVMKSKQVVRKTAKQHKGKVTSLSSWGKYLISVSQDEDLIIVYDYQKQQDYRQVSLQSLYQSGDTKASPRVQKNERPTYALIFKHANSGRDILLIGTDQGSITCYDLESKKFSQQINAECLEKSKKNQAHTLHFRQK